MEALAVAIIKEWGAFGLLFVVVVGIWWSHRQDIKEFISDIKGIISDHREDRNQWMEDAKETNKEIREIVKCNSKRKRT